MQKINDFSYSKNGITLVFSKVSRSDKEFSGKYAFCIPNDPDLTKKLQNSVKRKEVEFSSIFPCAKALFTIIEKSEFTPLLSGSERDALYKKYAFLSKKQPTFEVKDLTILPTNPSFEAKLIHDDGYLGTGRTIDEAKSRALEQFVKKTL